MVQWIKDLALSWLQLQSLAMVRAGSLAWERLHATGHRNFFPTWQHFFLFFLMVPWCIFLIADLLSIGILQCVSSFFVKMNTFAIYILIHDLLRTDNFISRG